MVSKEIKRRLKTPVDGSIPLKDRLDLPRLKAALEEPLFMDFFITDEPRICDAYDIPKKALNPCGTIGCIAGNTVLNEFPIGSKKTELIHEELGMKISVAAALILRLSQIEAGDPFGSYLQKGLFYISFPQDVTPGTKAYNAQVKKAVKTWLKERGVKW